MIKAERYKNISQEICKATNLNELHKQRNTYGTI